MLHRHESLVMVSGGSGICPFISIIREFIFQSNNNPDYKTPNLHLICVFKNSADLSMLNFMLPISDEPIELSKIHLQIEAYVTRDTDQPKTENQKELQSIWFKPNPSDSPVSGALGCNSWLWLAVIIASSFVLFLLLLGIVTRFYIYPIERNGTGVYHYSYKCLWDMFLVCVCVFLASSAVFLWRKKQRNAIEVKQIQNMEMPTPITSPGSRFYSADRELESLPNECLVKAIKFHFGERPNLNSKSQSSGLKVTAPQF